MYKPGKISSSIDEQNWEYRPKAHKHTEATLILDQIEIWNSNSEILAEREQINLSITYFKQHS